MKFKFLLFALLVVAYTHTGCRNVEQEQRKLALDSLTAIRRVADSVEQITPLAGARFGSHADEVVQAIDGFNRINDYSINDFKYDHIDPYYFDEGLMEIKIVGDVHNWSEYDSVYKTVADCIYMFSEKYGHSVEVDSTIEIGAPNDESMLMRWAKGDKNISVRIISDEHRFLFEIDIWSEKMRMAYVESIVDRVKNPL